MLKSNKLGSIVQINQDDIKRVTGAQFGVVVLCLMSAIGSSIITATATLACFRHKYKDMDNEFQRLKDAWSL